ncbi:Aste57867_4003 [Aphanomyces stellatus]|uniref:Aste57867_4003 protein n=1 Tax=Aphanomyces stellatus TaxID=120398 RepID=A0A485KBX0_9STRA|nr:hypothetical protein As57867_003992 [Aphanomyces stellatus]VFT81138.1 Aste57867_4003 [Aphanomyces stellatus]
MVKKEEPKEVVVEAPVVEVPKDPPGREMVWSVLTRDQTDALLALPTPAALVAALCDILHVVHYAENPRSRAWIDFCFYNFMFAKEDAGFDAEKLALFFAIMVKVFDHATTAPLPSLADNYALLKQLLKQHSVDLVTSQDDDGIVVHVLIFTLHDVHRIVAYLTTTFYQHFKAYQHAFRVHPAFVRHVRTVAVETPLPAIAMSTALELQQPTVDPPPRDEGHDSVAPLES